MSADAINRILEDRAPALAAALSPLGRRAFYPKGIPYQAGEARGMTYNGTIGIFTDGHGKSVPLPSMASTLELPEDDRHRAFLYSPVDGVAEVRQLWREWQRRGQPDTKPSTLPLLTIGLAHGLSILADLFGGEGRTLALATPFWGNYRQTFTLRTGTELRTAPSFRDGKYNTRFVAEALDGLPAGTPALALVNFPSNPGGYSPTAEERHALKDSLVEIAGQRPLVVICDDAYSGFVFGEGVPRHSFFWDLVGAHEQLIPVKVDGATKEFAFFGGRVGFLTFGVDLQEEAWAALEGKVKCLVRSTVGSPVAVGQMILAQALRSGQAESQIEDIFRIAEERFHAVTPAIRALDGTLLKPMPFNAGFFIVLEIPEAVGVTAAQVRYRLLEEYDTGVVSVGERYLRIATCSVSAEALPELVRRIERAVGDCVG